MGKEPEFVKFISDEGDLVAYFGNKQVELCILLHKKDMSLDNSLDSYEVVKSILAEVGMNSNYLKELNSRKKYRYCLITTINNKQFVYPNYIYDYNKQIEDEYVLVPYSLYYKYDIIDDISFDIEKIPLNVTEMKKRKSCYIYKKMTETYEKQYKKEKTRVRK